MLLKIVIITSIIFSGTLGISKCPESVQLITVGEKANCTGFLFSPSAEKQAAEDHSNAKFFKDLNARLEKRKELTDKEIQILDKRLQLYINQSELLSTQLYEREKNNKWENIMWFSLGVLATGIAVYGAGQLK